MRFVHGLLGALALTLVASVATASVETDVTVKSSCSQPKVATAVTTQAVVPTTVATYTLPAEYAETPARTLEVTIPGERVLVSPARTVAVQTSSAVATQTLTAQAATPCVQTQTVQTAVDVDKTVWKKAPLKTFLANRHKEKQQRVTTQTVATTQTLTTETECKRKRLRDRLQSQQTALDGIELDP